MEKEVTPREPWSLRIARFTSICAVSFSLASLTSQAITEYNKDFARSLRLLDHARDLADCCQDTTIVNIQLYRTFPAGHLQSISRYKTYAPSSVATIEEIEASGPDTTQWVEIHQAWPHLPPTARYIRFRLKNNP